MSHESDTKRQCTRCGLEGFQEIATHVVTGRVPTIQWFACEAHANERQVTKRQPIEEFLAEVQAKMGGL